MNLKVAQKHNFIKLPHENQILNMYFKTRNLSYLIH